MVRTQIYLTPDEARRIGTLSDRTGRSRSEIIREAIDSFLDTASPTDRKAALGQARGMWQDRDGEDFVEARQAIERRTRS